MAEVIYNRGGHVAHIVVKLAGEDSWEAMNEAARLAESVGGVVYRLYRDEKTGTRYGVGSVFRGGLEISRAEEADG